MTRACSITFAAALLAGCLEASAPPPAPRPEAPPLLQSRSGGWRLLSPTPPGGKEAPLPAGYLEIRRVSAGARDEGDVYLICDEGFRPLGHVTESGKALRYRRNEYAQDQPLGQGPVPDQVAAVLDRPGPLYFYDLKGRPQGLP